MASYNPPRSKNYYNPASDKPFRVSRSKIDLFLGCPFCFYLDRKLGVGQPPGFPFNLNSAVDELLKSEFDVHREAGTKHPLIEEHGIDAVPFKHEDMDKWRASLHAGVQYLHEPTNFLITGGVDDIWVDPAGELIVVDYKATSKKGEVSLNAPWQIGYKRQAEVYQWLLRKNGFEVSNRSYFVYCNGDGQRAEFDSKLHFDVKVLPYDGDDSWVEGAIFEIHDCLNSDEVPKPSPDCDYCKYRLAVSKALKDKESV